jgi:hypothetical protein
MSEIRRQHETHRPGVNGQIGPAPIRNQVRSVEIRLDVLPEGGMRVSTPQARGWAVVASGPRQLLDALAGAFTEAQVASYAAWKGEIYELDALTEVDNTDPLAATVRTTRHGVYRDRRLSRRDVHAATDWTNLGNGRWRSPSGKTYREDCKTVQNVIIKRRMLGETA